MRRRGAALRVSGSISIFLAMLLACLFSACFALLEAARVHALNANARFCTEQAADAVLASYDRTLWEEYQLMFLETREEELESLSGAAALQQELIEGNYEDNAGLLGKNFFVLTLHLDQVTVRQYQLASDDDGAAFRRQTAAIMKEQVAKDAVQSLISTLTDTEEYEERGSLQEKEAMDMLDTLEQAPSESGTDAAGTAYASSGDTSGAALPSGDASVGAGAAPGGESAGNSSASGSITAESRTSESSASGSMEAGADSSPDGQTGAEGEAENPLEWMKQVKKNGIFAFLMPEEDISSKSIDLSRSISRRSLHTGTMETGDDGTNLTQKALFRLYLARYFPNVTDEGEEYALDYELEYLIAGRSSDKANLTAVANRLLLIREASNLVYLERDSQKSKEAYALALSITTALGNPELAIPVKHAILAAWAYAESLSDVRILLDEGKVEMVKTDEQWHTQLDRLGSSVTESDGEKQKKGLSYEGYLQLLLWASPERKLSERAMTLIEQNTGKQMDLMVSAMECSYEYRAEPLFWRFVQLGKNQPTQYQFQDEMTIEFGGEE